MTPELRTDPLTGLRVVISDGAALLASGDGPGAPAEAMLDRSPNPRKDLFWAAPATGVHEPLPWAASTPEQTSATLEAWRERIAAHAGAASVHAAVDGAGGGAPPVAQLYALPFVPQLIAREREAFTAYATRTMGGNLLDDLVQEEVRARDRIVAIDDEAVLIAPYGSRVAYQLMLAPRTGRRAFEDPGPVAGKLLHDALRRLAARFGELPPFTAWVRTAPSGAEFFGWRIDLLPRLREAGSLELGTGLQQNAVAPETVAAELAGL